MSTEAAAAEAAGSVTVVTATLLETLLARAAGRGRLRVIHAGMGLTRAGLPAGPLVSCGLAGALAPDLRPGTTVIPETIGTPDGRTWTCDASLTARLREAADRLGIAWAAPRLLTSPRLVVGPERAAWAGRGWGAVDMESAGLFAASTRVAAVRVILDGPEDELSAAWDASWVAARNPARWRDALRLAPAASRDALRAARIAAEAFAGRP